VIRLEKVTKYYGDKLAVENYSQEINDGEVCVLIGPSGCGKTTLLNMINRLIEPTSGHIYINERDTSRIKPELLRRSMGYAIQNVGLFPHMTVSENIGVVPELLHQNKGQIRKRTRDLLELVGLKPEMYMSKYPRELSGGEAQRIGVARALAADPPILLMDEPFGAVDPLTRENLQTQFAQIQKELKKTVILVTHDLDEAIRLADRIAVMRSGQLVQYDTPEVILSRPANMFVYEFVGVDRALKRLSRISVKKFIRPSPSISVQSSVKEALDLIRQDFSVWVVDQGGKLIGWADRSRLLDSSTIKEATIRPNISDVTISENATLRQALSVMLGQGIRSIPVTSANGRFVGEVSLSDVEAATANNESSYVHQKD
jgi:osmoprotectant transport system ATP-binding protein